MSKRSPKKACVYMGRQKKYRSRKSPAYPANACCNRYKIGNDGKIYRSTRNKNGICTWKRSK